MSEEIKSGIYMIYCSETHKYYIGQAKNIDRRFAQHKTDLRKNRHENQLMQADYNEYGELAFKFRVIDYFKEQYLNVMEGYYIDYYNSLNDGYNLKHMNERLRPKEQKISRLRQSHKQFELDNEFKSKIKKTDMFLFLMLLEISLIEDSLILADYDENRNISKDIMLDCKQIFEWINYVLWDKKDRLIDKIEKRLIQEIKTEYSDIEIEEYIDFFPKYDLIDDLSLISNILRTNLIEIGFYYKNSNGEKKYKELKIFLSEK